jgi:hypothetical protein
MTQTLRQRPIRTPSHLPFLPDGRLPRISGGQETPDVASALRTLSLRAYHAVKANQNGITPSRRSELAEIRAELRRLESRVHAENLDGLSQYVAALNQKVEAALDR